MSNPLSDHAFADYEMLLQLDQPVDQGPQQSTASEAQLASVPAFTYQTDQVCCTLVDHTRSNLSHSVSSPAFCMMRWQDAAPVHDHAAHGEATDWYHLQSAVVETCSSPSLLAHQSQRLQA